MKFCHNFIMYFILKYMAGMVATNLELKMKQVCDDIFELL